MEERLNWKMIQVGMMKVTGNGLNAVVVVLVQITRKNGIKEVNTRGDKSR